MATHIESTPERTPEQERRLGKVLWWELHGPRENGRHLSWDAPLYRKPSTTVAVKCGRCNGEGAIASFSIKFSGKCFACDGSGVRHISRAKYERQKALRKAMKTAGPSA